MREGEDQEETLAKIAKIAKPEKYMGFEEIELCFFFLGDLGDLCESLLIC